MIPLHVFFNLLGSTFKRKISVFCKVLSDLIVKQRPNGKKYMSSAGQHKHEVVFHGNLRVLLPVKQGP